MMDDRRNRLILIFGSLILMAVMASVAHGEVCVSQEDMGRLIVKAKQNEAANEMMADYEKAMENLERQVDLAQQQAEAEHQAAEIAKQGMTDMEQKCEKAVEAARPSFWDTAKKVGIGILTGAAFIALLSL